MCVGLCIEYRLWKNGTVNLPEKEYRNHHKWDAIYS